MKYLSDVKSNIFTKISFCQYLQVYPINKSKVFNSQNPNAPPIYACGKCHKEINDNDQAILCESGCHFWYHRYVNARLYVNFILILRY